MAEDEIIESICKGGKALDAAVRALYGSAAQPMLRYFVYRGGISSDEAEDALQETFIKIVRSAASFSGRRSGQGLDLADRAELPE